MTELVIVSVRCNLKQRGRGSLGGELNIQILPTTNAGCPDASGSRKKLIFEQGAEGLLGQIQV